MKNERRSSARFRSNIKPLPVRLLALDSLEFRSSVGRGGCLTDEEEGGDGAEGDDEHGPERYNQMPQSWKEFFVVVVVVFLLLLYKL